MILRTFSKDASLNLYPPSVIVLDVGGTVKAFERQDGAASGRFKIAEGKVYLNTFRADRMEDLAAHPTVKPLQMVSDAIPDCSNRNGIIFDAFAGSGTTLVSAVKTGRVGIGMEIDPPSRTCLLRKRLPKSLSRMQ